MNNKYGKNAVLWFLITNIWYMEGVAYEFFSSVMVAFSSNEQAEHSAGETIGGWLSRMNSLYDHGAEVQWLAAIFSAVFCIIIWMKCRYVRERLQEFSRRKVFLLGAYIWVYGLVFVSYDQFKSFYYDYGIIGVDLSPINKLIVLLLTLGAALFIWKYDLQEFRKYAYGRQRIWLWIVIAYFDFAACGAMLFMNDTALPWSFSLQKVAVFLLFAIWLLPFVCMILHFFEYLELKKVPIIRNKCVKNSDILSLFVIMSVCLGFYFYIIYPGVITLDGIVAWTQIMNGQPLTREFPAFIKLVWKALYTLFPNVAIVSVFQAALWIWLVMTYLVYFVSKGMNVRIARVIAFVTSFFTPFTLYIFLHESNYYYTVALLWVTYFLIRFCNDNEYFKSRWYAVIGMSIAVTSIFLTRNEGKITYGLIIAIIFMVGFFKKQIRIVMASLLSVMLVFFVQIPVFHALEIPEFTQKSDNSVNLLVNDVTLATVHYDGRLSWESIQTLENYDSMQNIGDMYNEYAYDWEADASIASFVGNSEEVIPVAIDSIVHNIPIAFRERLNKTESVWSIVGSYGNKQEHCSVGIVDNELGLSTRDNFMYLLFSKLLYYPTFLICILDVIIYRSGLNICVLLVLCLYWIVKGQKQNLLVSVPAFAHFAVLLLSLLWPCSRHVWCIVLSVWVILIDQIYRGEEIEHIDNCSGL